MHVHVGIDDPDKAIHVANGMRVHLPVLLALTPTRRSGAPTRPACSRPARRSSAPSRASGIPPHYDDWERLRARDRVHGRAGVIEDYTYLWYDVRPHPNFGTVEIRVMRLARPASSTRSALAALVQAMVKELCEHYDAGERARATTRAQMLDENKWLAARHGLDGELVDLPSSERVPTRRWRGACSTACASTPRTSARPASSRPIEDLLAPRQRRRTPDRRLRGQPRPARGHGRDRRGDGAGRAPRPARSAARAGGARRARSRPASAGSRSRSRRS